MRQFLAVLLITALIGIAATGLRMEAGAQLTPDAQSDNVYAWAVLKSNIDGKKFLRLQYKDGRILEIGITHIVKANYYPKEWAKQMGLKHPYVELSVMGKDSRVDFLDEGDAFELFEAMSGGNDEVLIKSTNYEVKPSGKETP